MKRKVINISGNTMMVSLPAKWVAENNVKKGDEIDLEEKPAELIVRTQKSTSARLKGESVTIDIKNNEKIGRRFITALYRKGIKEFNLHYENPLYFKSIQDTLYEQTLGLEIVEQKNNSCKILDLTGDHQGEFETVLRRSWLLIKQMSEDSLNAMKKKDYNSLENMHNRDREVNKLTNYCIRLLLNEDLFDKYKTGIYTHFIRNLEELGDQFQNYSVVMSREKNCVDEVLDLYTESVALFDLFYELFYNYKTDKIESLFNKTKDICSRMENNKSIKISNIQYYYLYNIADKIRRLLSTVLELNCDKIGL